MSAAQLPLVPTPPPEPEVDVDFWTLQGQAITGIPDWRWYALKHVDPDITLVTGGVCRVMFKSGPRKGQPNWSAMDKATERTIGIKRSDDDTFRRQWELKTGRCHVCCGRGQQFWGWSKAYGCRYRPCSRCGATGKHPVTP